MTTGERIRDKMNALNLSGNELARRANITSAGMSKILNDKSTPKIDAIANIAKVLNTSTDYLILGTEKYKNVIESDLLSKFNSLSYDNQNDALSYITKLWIAENSPQKRD